MRETTRKLVFFIAVLVFFISAPVIILYARGYRLDWQKMKLIKTGAIYLNTTPKEAEIYINGEFKGITPFLVKSLRPNNYLVEIKTNKKETWSKTLNVYPSTVTEATSVLLIDKEYAAQNIIPQENILKFWPNTNWDKISYLDDEGKIWLYTEEDDQLNPIKATTTIDSFAIWAEEDIILITGDKSYYVFDFKEKKFFDFKIEIPEIKNPKIENLKWNPDNKEEIFFTNQNLLYKFNYQTLQLIPLLQKEIIAYQPIDSQIYYILESNKLFYRIDLEKKSTVQVSLIPIENISANAQLIIQNNQVAIIDKGNLFLFKSEKREFEQIDKNVQKIKVSASGSKILIQKNKELFVYYLNYEKDNKEFITRYGKKINNCLWFGENHIIFTIENDIKITEIDIRSHLNIFDLATTTPETAIKLDQENSELYFISEEGLKKIKIIK